MDSFFVFLFSLLIVAESAFGSSPVFNKHSYVFGSKTRVFGKDYEVFVINGKNVKFGLEGEQSGDIGYEPKSIEADETVVKFLLAGNTETETLNLTSKPAGSACGNSVEIRTVVENKYSVIVHTDKSVYKHGDKVAFKVFVLDHKMRLYQPTALSLKVENGFGDVYKEISDEFGETLEEFFEIDDSAVSGNYKILVKIDDEAEFTQAGGFEISNIPAMCFDLLVDVKKSVLMSENNISLEVSANYATGLNAPGKVKVFATVYEENLEGKHWSAAIKESDVETSNIFVFDFDKDLKLATKGVSQYFVEFTVEFEESKSKQKVKSVHRVKICSEDCQNVDILLVESDLKPGFHFPFKVETYFDFHGEVVVLVRFLLEFVDTASLREVEETFKQQAVNGTAEFNVQIPLGTLQATFIPKMNKQKLRSVFNLRAKSNEYLNAEIVNKK